MKYLLTVILLAIGFSIAPNATPVEAISNCSTTTLWSWGREGGRSGTCHSGGLGNRHRVDISCATPWGSTYRRQGPARYAWERSYAFCNYGDDAFYVTWINVLS